MIFAELFFLFFSNSSILQIYFAGTPAKTPFCRFLLTRLPAPTITFGPILTFERIVVFAPINTLSFNSIHPICSEKHFCLSDYSTFDVLHHE